MTDFNTEIRQRAAETQRSLREARAAGDDYLVEVHLGEMESLARIAAEHHVTLDGVEEDLAAHGLPTPAPGVQLADTLARGIALGGTRDDAPA